MREALLACLGMMTVAGQFIDAEAPEPKLTAQFARMLQTSDNATVFIDPSPEPSPSPSPEGEPVCINTCMYSSVRERTLLHIICAQRMSKRCVCWEARAHLLQHELEPLPDLLRGAPLRRRTLDSLAPSPCSWKAGEVASDATWISKNK